MTTSTPDAAEQSRLNAPMEPGSTALLNGAKLRPFRSSEVVIGLIAPLGTDLQTVRSVLKSRLETAGYKVFEVRITTDVIPLVSTVAAHTTSDFEARTTALMNAGNDARRTSSDNGILALGAATTIAALRKADQLAKDASVDNVRRAYIISSLKHPAEVTTLRMIYQQGFHVIGVHADRERRIQYLVSDKRVATDRAVVLIDRDEDEHVKHGQRVSDSFHLSDFFVRMDGSADRLRNGLWRVVDLLFGHPYLTPTFDEYAMFMAFTASLRSADLSRQVGAVVARSNQILATGANDCPCAGGGLYWPEIDRITGECTDRQLGRDFKRGEDSNAVERFRIMDDIVQRARTVFGESARIEEFQLSIQAGRVRDLTEYGRVVHAEMEALLSCGRAGVGTSGATLYTTTFPCHNCAKHIIAGGIERVVFIEPYQKSKAFQFHSEAMEIGFQGEGPRLPRVSFEPFVGVGPRRFFDLFSAQLGSGYPLVRKEDTTGKSVSFVLENSTLRLQMLPYSYIDVEEEAAASFQKAHIQTGESSDGR